MNAVATAGQTASRHSGTFQVIARLTLRQRKGDAKMKPSRWLPWIVTAALAMPAYARIKLITLPVRERVEIQLDHESATLVEEERIVPLVKGENQVDFSWAGTNIDPNTIVFRVIGPAGENKQLDVKVASVSYPPNEAALVWT